VRNTCDNRDDSDLNRLLHMFLITISVIKTANVNVHHLSSRLFLACAYKNANCQYDVCLGAAGRA